MCIKWPLFENDIYRNKHTYIAQNPYLSPWKKVRKNCVHTCTNAVATFSQKPYEKTLWPLRMHPVVHQNAVAAFWPKTCRILKDLCVCIQFCTVFHQKSLEKPIVTRMHRAKCRGHFFTKTYEQNLWPLRMHPVLHHEMPWSECSHGVQLDACIENSHLFFTKSHTNPYSLSSELWISLKSSICYPHIFRGHFLLHFFELKKRKPHKFFTCAGGAKSRIEGL